MTKISGSYTGDLKCTLLHDDSSTTIYTDAPKDIGGNAETFSPTDLVAAALASCIATTLGLYGKRKGWDFKDLRFEVTKEMTPAPDRRINRLKVILWMPISLTHEEQAACERVAHSCPVHKSLHLGIEAPIVFNWPK